MKKTVFLFLGFVFAVTLWANLDRQDDLQRKQLEVVRAMHARRVELLKTNSELKRLQEEKMKLHRKMGILLDADPELFELQQQYAALDAELNRLRREAPETLPVTDSSVVRDSARFVSDSAQLKR